MFWIDLCASNIWLSSRISLFCVVVVHNLGTVFAYGQTNSGKTHTMRGSPTEPGIIPLAVNNLFDVIHQVFLKLLHCYPWSRLGYTKSIFLFLFFLLFWFLHFKVYEKTTRLVELV